MGAVGGFREPKEQFLSRGVCILLGEGLKQPFPESWESMFKFSLSLERGTDFTFNGLPAIM